MINTSFLNVSGKANLSYGNCGKNGNVTVFLNGDILDTVSNGISTVFKFEFESGDELMLAHTVEDDVDNDSFPIIQFKNIMLICE